MKKIFCLILIGISLTGSAQHIEAHELLRLVGSQYHNARNFIVIKGYELYEKHPETSMEVYSYKPGKIVEHISLVYSSNANITGVYYSTMNRDYIIYLDNSIKLSATKVSSALNSDGTVNEKIYIFKGRKITLSASGMVYSIYIEFL